ncbi:diacylglycerol/lipid kinase family protein [Lysobacter xanthus]
MDRIVPVIVNASSHSGGNDADALRAALRQAGLAAELHVVRDPARLDEAIDTALAGSPPCIVAAGGDGTINAVAARALDAGIPLGVLPGGTLNHFARDLGLPDDLEGAARAIAAGHVREVDVGEVNGRLFLNNASLGLYATMVAHRERAQARRHLGKGAALLQAAWRALRRPHAFSVVLHVDGQDLPRRTPFVFVGNNDYVVQGPNAGARPTLDDGVLSVYVLRRTGTWFLIGLALRALVGRVSDEHDLEGFAVTELVVESRRTRVRLARDGEVGFTESPVRFRVRPRALRVLAPPPEPD